MAIYADLPGEVTLDDASARLQFEVPSGHSAEYASGLTVDSLVLGPPTTHYRDNLRSDLKYITSWPSAGWTNDVISAGNLLYVGKLTGRVVVMPHFVPSHVGSKARILPFGEVFNVSRIIQDSGIPIVEWRDVKQYEWTTSVGGADAVDDMGCWSVWMASQKYEPSPRYSYAMRHIGLDLSFTQAPEWIRLQPGNDNDKCTTFDGLLGISYPDAIKAAQNEPIVPSDLHRTSLPVDDHLLCMDYIYYSCDVKSFDINEDFSPAWRYAFQYMRWADRLEYLADLEVRRALGVDERDPTPPYISVHVRRADFATYCTSAGINVNDCFAPLSAYAQRVKEAQDDLFSRKGYEVEHVIMTSDERDEPWWKGVELLGWKRIDHGRTAKLYGDWYPVLIDAVVQSNGMGFVGTSGSTMSDVAKRRVETWHDGSTSLVQWGKPGADNH